jgi:hypothetical protein
MAGYPAAYDASFEVQRSRPARRGDTEDEFRTRPWQSFVGEVIGFFTRTVRAVRLLARDGRIPKPLRVLAGIGLLPIPGPLDEAVLVLLAPVFLVFYRGPMREAWEQSAC